MASKQADILFRFGRILWFERKQVKKIINKLKTKDIYWLK